MKVNTTTNHHEVSFCNRHDVLLLPFLLSLLSLTTISALILLSTYVSADNNSTVDQINITVPMSCTMSGTGMDSHNTNINNGTYTSDIGTTIMHVFCNDNEGFAIYAAGYTNDEISGENSNKLVGTNASGNATIESGLATSAGNPDVSNWAMKLAITQDSGDTTADNAFTIDSAPNVALPSEAEQGATAASFSEYHVVPNEYVKVAHKNSGTDMTTTTGGVKLTTTYAAYISKTQPADTYSGQVIYTLVHPSSEAPNTNISIEDAYAKNGKQKYNGYYKMQEMSDSICTIVTLYDEASQTQLIDVRDNKIYYVAKLQDGNCWMTQNLDHDIVTTPNYYTNENTDIGYNSTTHSYDTATWTAEYATHTSADAYWCDEQDEYHDCLHTVIASHNPGELYWNGTAGSYDSESECTAAGGTWKSTGLHSCNQISSTGNPHYHLGNYYNWSAATATNNTNSIADETLTDRSICPAGWTLPRPGTGANSFYNLLSNYGLADSPTLDNQNIWNSPLYFGLSGVKNQDSETMFLSVGYHGWYWTPYLVDHDYTTALAVGYFFLYPGDRDSVDGGNTAFGLNVRCIARPVINTIEGL